MRALGSRSRALRLFDFGGVTASSFFGPKNPSLARSNSIYTIYCGDNESNRRACKSALASPAASGALLRGVYAGSVMRAPRLSIATVFSAIERAGLVQRGALPLADDERTGALADLRTIVLIGVAGRSGWDAFAASDEARGGQDHPLDRWSRRVINGLAVELGAAALFPFGGPPNLPFQQWALRAEPVHPSPIGMLIHPAYGLWHSYRGALGFADALDIPAHEATPSPCETCRERPCLGACPVGAFSAGGYDVPACAGHLTSSAGADCMERGCRARRACLVGAEHAHGADQAAFAMQAFSRAVGAA